MKSALVAFLMLASVLGSWGASVSAGPTTIPMEDIGAPASSGAPVRGGEDGSAGIPYYMEHVAGAVLGVIEAPREIPDICPEVCRTPE